MHDALTIIGVLLAAFFISPVVIHLWIKWLEFLHDRFFS